MAGFVSQVFGWAAGERTGTLFAVERRGIERVRAGAGVGSHNEDEISSAIGSRVS
jgi:hypothetical protein